MVFPGSSQIYSWIYNLWCLLCLYTLGALYLPIEVNRKLNWFSTERYLDVNKDIPTSLSHISCIITGGSRGIGWEACKVLLEKGARVIVASSSSPGRDIEALKKRLLKDFQNHPTIGISNVEERLDVWHLNLDSFQSVFSFVSKYYSTGRPLNLLITNAGQMYAPFRVTEDGFESHWQINYLSHCLLIFLFFPLLESSGRKSNTWSRIVNVASSTHFARNLNMSDINGFSLYSPYHAYAQSKLAQIMFTYQMDKLLRSKQKHSDITVTVNCLHPGVAKTELYEHVWWVKSLPFVADIFFRTPKDGAETVLYAALSSELEGIGGKYLEDLKCVSSSRFSNDEEKQATLWKMTVSSLQPWIVKFFSERQVNHRELILQFFQDDSDDGQMQKRK